MLSFTQRLQTLHTLLSSKLWCHLLTIKSILGNNWENSTKSMKNQSENKNCSYEFHQFIHDIADLTGPLCIFYFSIQSLLIQKENITNSGFFI